MEITGKIQGLTKDITDNSFLLTIKTHDKNVINDCNNLKDNIKVLGYVSNPIKLLATSKVMLMTSRFEGTPMVAIEAQILGVPIVTTPVDGMVKIIIHEKNGYLLDKDNDIVDSLNYIINHPEKRKQMSQSACEMSKPFTDVREFKQSILKEYVACLNQ